MPRVRFSKGEVAKPGSRELLSSAVGSETYEVVAGDLNDAAKAAFGRGQCHAMAFAIREVTGWPIRAVNVINGDFELLTHVVAQGPSGELVDSRGSHSESEMIASYSRGPFTAVIRNLDQEHLSRLLNPTGAVGSFRSPELALARALTSAVLESAGFVAEASRASRLIASANLTSGDRGAIDA